MRNWLAVLAFGLTVIEAGAAQSAAAEAAQETRHIERAVRADDRPDSHRLRDTGRKPGAVLAFLGLAPGMTVYEHGGSSGYYSVILSRATGPEGRLIVQNSAGFWPRLKDTVEPLYNRLGNVTAHVGPATGLDVAAGSVDFALISLLYHHMHFDNMTGDDAPPEASKRLFTRFYEMMAPGGIIGVIDHEAPHGTPRSSSANWHRATLQNAVDDFTAAGFIFEASSDLLANPADPQTVSFGALDSGRDTSQRFVAKFRKPE